MNERTLDLIIGESLKKIKAFDLKKQAINYTAEDLATYLNEHPEWITVSNGFRSVDGLYHISEYTGYGNHVVDSPLVLTPLVQPVSLFNRTSSKSHE